jgi:hypothetical protein
MTAQSDASTWDTGQWRFTGTLYAWFPQIDGKFTLPTTGRGDSFVVDASDLLDNLNFAFMGTLDAHNGRWGLFTDLIYMDIDGSKSGTQSFSIGGAAVPANLTGQVDLNLKSTAWTIAGEYRLVYDPQWQLDLVAGLRMLSVEPELSWAFQGDVSALRLPARAGTTSQSPTNWDGIIGVKGGYRFGANQEWFIPLYFDIGTGDSQLTWQAAAGIGYNFHWGSLVAMWRHLDYEFDDGEPVSDLSFNGPMIGAQFHW